MNVVAIPYHDDNYCYVVWTAEANFLTLIDPGHMETVLGYIEKDEVFRTMEIRYAFSTHKHWDHAGDNLKLKERLPNLEIIGGVVENIPACTKSVQNEETFVLENGISVTCFHTPCHTTGHIFVYLVYQEQKAVFTGDTVMVGGCGKFFEGNAEDMNNAFNRFKSLPDDTKVYIGHEYAVSNLNWSTKVDVDNQYMKEKLQEFQKIRESGAFVVPTTVGEEKRFNIFLNADRLKGVLGVATEVEAVGKLREMKDNRQTLV